MRSPHALLALALSAGLLCLAAPAQAQAPGRWRGETRQDPPRVREQPRQPQPDARPRQDPPPRAEPARAPEAERRPPARSTGEPELRRRKP